MKNQKVGFECPKFFRVIFVVAVFAEILFALIIFTSSKLSFAHEKEDTDTIEKRSQNTIDEGYHTRRAQSEIDVSVHDYMGNNKLIYSKLDKYPPRMSMENLLYGSRNHINCVGDIYDFADYEELLKTLIDLDYPFDDIPIAWTEDYWFTKEIKEISDKARKDKKEINMAIVVPLRGRCMQVRYFIPYMHYFLQNHVDGYRIFIVEQNLDDGKVFNRAALMNTGFLLANIEANIHGKEFDYFVFHDVDALPLDRANAYSYSPYIVHRGPYRNNLCRKLYELSFEGYFGGITSFSTDVYHSIGGMGNGFWGWGKEDDEVFMRWTKYFEQNIESKGIKFPQILRPSLRDGKIWTFPDSSERVKFTFDKSHKNRFLRNNEYQLYLMTNKKYKYKLHNEIIKLNGYKKLIGRIKIHDYSVTDYFSFYSISFLMTYAESRNWSDFTKKYLKHDEQKRLEILKRDLDSGKKTTAAHNRKADWIRGFAGKNVWYVKEDEKRNCKDLGRTDLLNYRFH